MRMIDADALMELYADRLTVVAERYSPDSSECGILSGVMKLLEIQPTIEERKTGKWIDGKCDQCGSHAPFYPMATTYYESNFCPNCGAKMEGEKP